jgi:hypothetical protein
MFDSLTDQMRADENKEASQRERLIHYGLIALVSIVLVSAIFLAIRFAS